MDRLGWDSESHCWDTVIDAETQRLYAPYARDLRLGDRPAVLVVDVYRGIFERPAQASGPGGETLRSDRVLERIGLVLARVREAGLPVFHSSDARLGDTSGVLGLSATHRQAAKDPSFYEFMPEARPLDGEGVVLKRRASAFFGTDLRSALTSLQRDCVIVVGETTSGCVRASAVDAFSSGFHTVVVEDACFDRAFLPHVVNLFDLHHKYADVMSSAALSKLLS